MKDKTNGRAFPFLSVIVPAYNSQHSIEECLQSLINQNYPKDRYEIIVVNDGSTDRTADILQKYNRSKLIRVIHHDKNRGLAAARNTGIKNSNGDILVFIDSDMIADKNFLLYSESSLSRAGTYGVVGKRLPHPSLPMDKYQKYRYFSKIGAEKLKDPKKPIPLKYFILGISAVKKEVIREVGFFDESIQKWGGEDNELACRIFKVHPQGQFYCPKMTALHKHYRPFKDELNNIYNFSRYNLPILAEKHSEIIDIYYLKFAFCNRNNPFLYKLLGKLISTTFIREIGLFLYDILPFPLSNAAIKLLIANRLLKGYCDEVQK